MNIGPPLREEPLVVPDHELIPEGSEPDEQEAPAPPAPR